MGRAFIGGLAKSARGSFLVNCRREEAKNAEADKLIISKLDKNSFRSTEAGYSVKCSGGFGTHVKRVAGAFIQVLICPN